MLRPLFYRVVLALATNLASCLADSTGLAQCLSAANIPVAVPSSSNFAQHALPYNLRLQYQPAAIALPTTTQHISDAVLCASKSDVKVQAKSGGHSYASFSSGGQNGSMVVDLESFQNITVDMKGVAQVGSGVRLGNLALGIYNQGRRALPHGTCPGVGVGGHASHGGYWYSSRMWGLTVDTIVGLDVILANGSFVHASQTEYPDIYWALRGAADSFGIITTFSFQTQPAPSVINWSYKFDNTFTTSATMAQAFSHIQEFALNASVVDENIGFGVSPSARKFDITGMYRGDINNFRNKIAPELLRGLPTPTSSNIKQFSDWTASLADQWGGPLQQPLTGYNAHDNFYAKSLIVPEDNPLTISALTTYFTYILSNGSSPALTWFSELNLLGGPNSLVTNPPPSAADSAYSNRNALWILQHYANTQSEGAIAFVNGLNAALERTMPDVKFAAYANYVDSELSREEAHRVYFEKGRYERLVRVKGVVDPRGVFENPQSVEG